MILLCKNCRQNCHNILICPSLSIKIKRILNPKAAIRQMFFSIPEFLFNNHPRWMDPQVHKNVSRHGCKILHRSQQISSIIRDNLEEIKNNGQTLLLCVFRAQRMNYVMIFSPRKSGDTKTFCKKAPKRCRLFLAIDNLNKTPISASRTASAATTSITVRENV